MRQPPAGGAPNRVMSALLQARWLILGVMLASGLGIAAVWPTMKSELSLSRSVSMRPARRRRASRPPA